MKSILVIGGNSDIGFAICKEFIKDNFKIILASRNIAELDEKKKILHNLSVKCETYYFDIEDQSSYKNFFDKLRTKPDILIISCGYLEVEEKNYQKIININYLSKVNFIEDILSKKDFFNKLNSIIGISSLAGERGKERLNIYSSAKAGFTNYIDGLRQRLHKNSINVYTVKPGFVKTKMTNNMNLNKFLIITPERLAKKIYKCYKKKKYIIYPSLLWRIILFIYKIIPEKIFIKLKT